MLYLVPLAIAVVAFARASRTNLHKKTEKEDEKKNTKQNIYERRKRLFCAAQSISYESTNPLLIVRGKGVHLFDETEKAYLDTRNNVCHVGHSHPRVAEAIAKQAFTLNTNTRYLHPNITNLAEKLLSKFPSELCVVFFVNSGSEANDLALRLASTHTKRKDVIVVERAYHGNTTAVMEISPYKYEHKGGAGQAPHVHKVPCPDTYRGVHRGPTAASDYANYVEQACQAAHQRDPGLSFQKGVSAFFIESGMSVAGVILPPQGYLRAAYTVVRAAGGVCVADEVQTGFGRFGTSFWGFEQQGVVPDIVTMGKPFGNGMALAAVVTTRAIGDSFHNGLEYFNTFGGNPVSCAAGLSVMEIVEEEKLQENAKDVGQYLMEALGRLQRRFDLIGDVRGSGLFIGIEFVVDRASRLPATQATSTICARMKDEFSILTSIDGAHDNVMVMKPPLCFSRENANTFIDSLAAVLMQLEPIDM